MRPTLTYVKEKFDYYNKLCFDGKLKMPTIKLCLRKTYLGLTNSLDGHIEISVREDLPEEEYIDTIVHEMIHYYIITNNIKDDAMHGKEFRRIMDDIIKKHGIKITIAYEPTEEELVKKVENRQRYVPVLKYHDGTFGISVVAKNKKDAIVYSALNDDSVEKVELYTSNRAIFATFPVQIIPRFLPIEEDKLKFYLTGARNETSSIISTELFHRFEK